MVSSDTEERATAVFMIPTIVGLSVKKTPPAQLTLLSAKINSTKAALWIMKISTQKNLQAAVKWQLFK